jgi:hypothetical protein
LRGNARWKRTGTRPRDARDAEEPAAWQGAREGASAACARGPRPDIKKWIDANPDKVTIQRCPTKPISDFTIAARAVFRALGHDSEGKCPSGVDWRNNARKVPEELRAENYAASTRASCHLPLVHMMSRKPITAPDTLPGCGWKWCEEKDKYKVGDKIAEDYWNNLKAALDDLKGHDRDPNGHEVALLAATYARFMQYAEGWNAYIEHASVIARTPDPEYHFSLALRQAVGTFQWAKAPREGGGRPTDKPVQLFLNGVHASKGDITVAAAISFLFGLAPRGTDYAGEKDRIAKAWKAGGDLNRRLDSDAVAKEKAEADDVSWRRLNGLPIPPK